MDQNPYAAPTAHTTQEGSPAQLEEPQDWTISEVINVGWKAVGKDPLVLIGSMLLPMLIQQGFSLITGLFVPAMDPTDPAAGILGTLIVFPFSMALSAFFAVGQLRIALAAARDEAVEFGTLFTGIDRALPYFLALIITSLATMLGLVFLVIPGVIIALGFSLVSILAADTKLSISELLSESWSVTKGQKMQLFIFALACLGVFLLGFLALCVGVLVAMPVVMVAFAEVYIRITGRRSGA